MAQRARKVHCERCKKDLSAVMVTTHSGFGGKRLRAPPRVSINVHASLDGADGKKEDRVAMVYLCPTCIDPATVLVLMDKVLAKVE